MSLLHLEYCFYIKRKASFFFFLFGCDFIERNLDTIRSQVYFAVKAMKQFKIQVHKWCIRDYGQYLNSYIFYILVNLEEKD